MIPDEMVEVIKKLATEWICPNTHCATTAYEHSAIKLLVSFGHALVGALSEDEKEDGDAKLYARDRPR